MKNDEPSECVDCGQAACVFQLARKTLQVTWGVFLPRPQRLVISQWPVMRWDARETPLRYG
jgi:hypothetical protein